ncbi:thymidine kinase [Ensifer soli]|uniref:thymidine kinase n=1 Tax=Ciceribacter sp. sgz301302 TaxID=3342379 RepID=UPI0035BA3533
MAKLYFHYSAMNAGKSTILLQAAYNYEERGMRTVILVPALSDRTGTGRVASRIGLSADAVPFDAGVDLLALVAAMTREAPVACVFVDEAHFMSEAQVWQLARIADRLEIPVLAYGLRTDFRGEVFPPSVLLLGIADELREVRTICHCGRKATMVVRLGPDGKVLHKGAQLEVGGNEKYVSLCRRHWDDMMNGPSSAGDAVR